MNYLIKRFMILNATALFILLSINTTISFAQTMTLYENEENGFKLLIPKTLQHIDFIQSVMPGVEILDILLNSEMKLQIRKGRPYPIDSSKAVSMSQTFNEASRTFGGLRIIKEPQLIKIGEIQAIVYHQFNTITQEPFNFLVNVKVSDENKSIDFGYWFNINKKDKLLSIVENSYQTFKFIRPMTNDESSKSTITTTRFDEYLNSRLRIAHDEAIKIIYDQYSWVNSSLKKARQQINELRELTYDFINPTPIHYLAYLLEEDSSETWKLYLNIFHRHNWQKWYPSRLKKISSPQIYNQLIKKSQKITEILNSHVTKDEWEKIVYRLGDKCKVTVHSNLGSGLTIADIIASLEEIEKRNLWGPKIEYFDNIGFGKFIFNMYRMMIGEDISLEWWPEEPILEDNLFLFTAMMAIFDVKTRTLIREEIMKVADEDIIMDIYIHKDRSSFVKALHEAGLSTNEQRAFMLPIKDGKSKVHVKAPDSICGHEASFFEFVYHGESDTSLIIKAEKIYSDFWYRLMYAESDISAEISHELDHQLFNPGINAPVWLVEGQATYFGERAKMNNLYGIETSKIKDSLLIFKQELGLSDSVLYGIELYEGRLYSTKREVEYTKLIDNRKNSLVNDLQTLVLTPNKYFYDKHQEKLNYALSWGLFKTVKYAASQNIEDWDKYKPDWDRLCSMTTKERELEIKKFKPFFKWIANMFDKSLLESR